MNKIIRAVPDAGGGHWKDGRVETMEFLCEDIYEDGMVECVYEANEKAIAYHAAGDAETEKVVEKN